MDCIIIGGGISGLLCARELAAGGFRVRVIERNTVGSEASWAGGGILSPLYPWRQPLAVQNLSLWSHEYYPKLAQSLKQSTGIDPQWNRCGLLWLDLPDLDVASAWCRRQHMCCETPDQDKVNRIQPGLRIPDEEPHLWLSGIAQIRNPRLLKALKQELESKGVDILERSPVIHWQIRNNKVVSIDLPQENLKADLFLIAAGAWSAKIGPENFWSPDIHPVKGQMLLFRARPGLLVTMVQLGEHYLIPRLDGRILAGSTVEKADFDKRPTSQAYDRLYRFAVNLLPALADFPVEAHWAGMRPEAPKGIPYIGPHPQLENLYYDCGHFRNGVVMAPAAARLLADLVLHRAPIVDPAPYLPINR